MFLFVFNADICCWCNLCYPNLQNRSMGVDVCNCKKLYFDSLRSKFGSCFHLIQFFMECSSCIMFLMFQWNIWCSKDGKNFEKLWKCKIKKELLEESIFSQQPLHCSPCWNMFLARCWLFQVVSCLLWAISDCCRLFHVRCRSFQIVGCFRLFHILVSIAVIATHIFAIFIFMFTSLTFSSSKQFHSFRH